MSAKAQAPSEPCLCTIARTACPAGQSGRLHGMAPLELCFGTTAGSLRAPASVESHSRATSRPLLGQASLEFMASAFLVLLLLGIAVWMYGTSMAEAGALKSSMEANRVCAQVSATLSSLASSGASTTYRFSLPLKVNGENYTVFIVQSRNLVKVDFANRGGVGCGLPSMNITNSSGASFFPLAKNATATSSNGVVQVA